MFEPVHALPAECLLYTNTAAGVLTLLYTTALPWQPLLVSDQRLPDLESVALPLSYGAI